MQRYWGPNNEYGPFSPQEDGWPNRGEVVRYYKKYVRRISTKELAALYGAALGTHISERYVQMLENNRFPADEKRRRVLASVLGIPPMLFGLAELKSLSNKDKTTSRQATLDTSHYSSVLNLYWTLDYTSSAQNSIQEIENITQELRRVGSLELLCGFYPLISTVYADQLNFPVAFDSANQAVSIATELNNNKLLAVAKFQRGFVNLQRGSQQNDKGYLSEALTDLEEALPLSVPRVAVGVLMDVARLYGYLKQKDKVFSALQQAEKIMASKGLRDGSFIDSFAALDQGRHHLGRAVAFVLIGESDEAEVELDVADQLIPGDQTRRLAWSSIIRAQAYLANKDYSVAAELALTALKASKDIKSGYNISLIQNIYSQLVAGGFNSKPLGAALLS